MKGCAAPLSLLGLSALEWCFSLPVDGERHCVGERRSVIAYKLHAYRYTHLRFPAANMSLVLARVVHTHDCGLLCTDRAAGRYTDR